MVKHSLFIIRILASVGLLVATTGSVLSQAPSARDILVCFCDLDAQGGQMTPAGWQKVAALFVAPGAPRRDNLTIVRDFVVSHPVFERDKAEFYVEYVEYIQLGRIDPSQGRFSPLPSVKVRSGFLVTRQSVLRSGGASGQAEESAEWRIEGPVPEPHLTVDAAIRYATELRANASDIATRLNADKMLVALKRVRQ